MGLLHKSMDDSDNEKYDSLKIDFLSRVAEEEREDVERWGD